VILAVGPEQKGTFCLASGTDAFVSQHLGDLSNAGAIAAYLEALSLYERLFALQPTVLVSDLHPDYFSTRWAQQQSAEQGLPLIQVQHHHAHIAAVIAEHMTGGTKLGQGDGAIVPRTPVGPLPRPPVPASSSCASTALPVPLSEQQVIGIALDGTGYGTDGSIWGGEVLVASLEDAQRFAHLECFPLPGGAQAIRHPLRAAYALLLQHGLAEHPAARGVRARLGSARLRLIEQMVDQGLNAPLTSSAGRLFDAVSSLLGICDEASYEGEPAILLEAALGGSGEPPALQAASDSDADDVFPDFPSPDFPSPDFSTAPSGENTPASPDAPASTARTEASLGALSHMPHVIVTRALILAILDGMQAGASVTALSRRFHEEFMRIFVDAAILARNETGLEVVALSGGVFNNRFLATQMPVLLREAGFTVLTHKLLPPNDGCISYGQAAVAAARLSNTTKAGTLSPCV
jgi:hydrogenase maturation protein HypF